MCAWDGQKQNFFEIIPEYGSMKPHCKNMRHLLAWEGKYPPNIDLVRYHAEEMYKMMMVVRSVPRYVSTAESRSMNRSKPLRLSWNFAGRFLRVLRIYLQDINTQFQVNRWISPHEQESSESMNSWGIRGFPSVKGFNLRPSSSPNNRFKPKCPKTQDSSKKERGGRREKNKNTKNTMANTNCSRF